MLVAYWAAEDEYEDPNDACEDRETGCREECGAMLGDDLLGE
jgi:hypothetical protein